ncbi:hypothetical protein LTR85_006540 [Meristemomyces frigidus]|nr:hypothetical protein LTR85_006540 [Meristemomyces frigidus]
MWSLTSDQVYEVRYFIQGCLCADTEFGGETVKLFEIPSANGRNDYYFADVLQALLHPDPDPAAPTHFLNHDGIRDLFRLEFLKDWVKDNVKMQSEFERRNCPKPTIGIDVKEQDIPLVSRARRKLRARLFRDCQIKLLDSMDAPQGVLPTSQLGRAGGAAEDAMEVSYARF